MATSIFRVKEMILKMEAASKSSPAKLITTYYQRTSCYIPKDFSLKKHCCEKLNLKTLLPTYILKSLKQICSFGELA
jgi:hypothetical protein